MPQIVGLARRVHYGLLSIFNDLPCLNEDLQRMYADNTNISLQSHDLNEAEELVNAEITKRKI